MLTCRNCKELLIESLSEKLTPVDHRQIDSHISHCEACSALATEIDHSREFVNKFQSRTICPEPETDLDNLWSRLEPELDRIDASRVTQLTNSRNRWRTLTVALATAACLVLVTGISLLPDDRSAVSEVTSGQLATDSNTDPDINRYLSRAYPILATIANVDGTDGFVPVDQGYAEIMALEAELLVSGHEAELSASQQRLLRDVQLLLTQYAALEQLDLASGLQVLQLLLENNSVLFRMSLAEMRNENPVI